MVVCCTLFSLQRRLDAQYDRIDEVEETMAELKSQIYGLKKNEIDADSIYGFLKPGNLLCEQTDLITKRISSCLDWQRICRNMMRRTNCTVCWEHCYPKYSLWDGVMMEVLKKDIVDENYNISLREMIDELYNNNDHRFVNGYDVYKEMLSDEEKRKQIFERLAYTSVTQNQDNKKMWDELLQACSEEEKKQYFLIISNFIEMVEYENMGYNGLLCEYELIDIVHYILPCFSSDQSIYKLSDAMLLMYRNIQEMEVDESKKVKQLYETMVQETYKNDPPRLLFTNKIVNCTCKEMGGVSDVMQKVLEKNKKDFWDRYERVKETFESNCPLKIREEYRLENWYD